MSLNLNKKFPILKMNDLNLSALKYFIDAVELKSVTASANKNNISRPAVSQAISRLEDWSGLNLVTHQKKIFALTKDGQIFYGRAKSVFGALNSCFDSDVSASKTIHVGCYASLLESVLLPAIKSIDTENDINIKAGSPRQIRNYLDDGIVNVAIVIDPAPFHGFRTETIGGGHYIFASKTGHLENPFVLTDDRPEVTAAREYLDKHNNHPERLIRTDSWTGCAKVANMLGGTCLITDRARPKNLKPVLLKNFKIKYALTLVYKSPEFLSSSEVRLVEALRNAKTN